MTARRILPARSRQHSLREPVSCVGVGLHTGCKVAMTIRPAGPNHGLRFLRTDVRPEHALIPARWYQVVGTELSTVLANDHGVTVGTVEHVLAALLGGGVDNALIEVDGPEVPTIDGSAGPFVSMIDAVGTVGQDADRWALWIQRPVTVYDGQRFALLMPDLASRITAEIDFPGTAIGHQRFTADVARDFRDRIAGARTFGFAGEIDGLRARGLARGGSLHNAVLVDGRRVVNPEGLRYADEFARHKVLDCLGDLALVGVPVVGHLYAYKPGHALNNQLIRKLFAESAAWTFLPIGRINDLLSRLGPDVAVTEPDLSALRAGTAH